MNEDKPKWIAIPVLMMLAVGMSIATISVLSSGKVGKGRSVQGYFTKSDDPVMYWLIVFVFIMCIGISLIGLFHVVRKKG